MIENIKNSPVFKKGNKDYLINILSYSLFTLSNLIFIFLIPSETSKIFLLNYSIANGVLSYLVVLLFSKKKILDVKYFLSFFLVSIVYCYFFLNLVILIWLYTFILIYSDYFFSQKKYIISNLLIKFFLFLISSLLFIDQFTIVLVMNIKIIFLIICITIFYILKIHLSRPLEIKRPNYYIVSTCVIYFGSLYIIAFVSANEFIKLFYISFQIFLSMRLKIFDLNIRGIIKLKKYRKILFILACIYFMIITIYSSSYFLFILFLITYYFLSYAEKKFINN
tara:strand:+ start:269 stop:1108 length:840 start_codon:yes stop_codon:yes gene_type:complete